MPPGYYERGWQSKFVLLIVWQGKGVLFSREGGTSYQSAVFMIASLGRMMGACNDVAECFAKHLAQLFGTATGRDMQEDYSRSDRGPEVTSFAFELPTGLINSYGQGRSDILFKGIEHRQLIK